MHADCHAMRTFCPATGACICAQLHNRTSLRRISAPKHDRASRGEPPSVITARCLTMAFDLVTFKAERIGVDVQRRLRGLRVTGASHLSTSLVDPAAVAIIQCSSLRLYCEIHKQERWGFRPPNSELQKHVRGTEWHIGICWRWDSLPLLVKLQRTETSTVE